MTAQQTSRVPAGGLAGILGTGRHAAIGRLWIGTSLVFLVADRRARRGARCRAPQDRHLQHPQPGQLRAGAVAARRRRTVPVRHPDPDRRRHDRRSEPGRRRVDRLPARRGCRVLDVPHRWRHGRGQLPDQRRTRSAATTRASTSSSRRSAWSSSRSSSRPSAWPRPSSLCGPRACRSHGCRCSRGRCSPPPRSGSPASGCCSGSLSSSTSTTGTGCSRSGRATTSITGCGGR